MNRRHFSKTLLAASASLPFVNRAFAPAIAADATTSSLKLAAVPRTNDVNGRAASVFGLATPDGKLGLNLIAGETVNVELANTLPEDTMIHWHGLLPIWSYDGESVGDPLACGVCSSGDSDATSLHHAR